MSCINIYININVMNPNTRALDVQTSVGLPQQVLSRTSGEFFRGG